MRRRSSAFTSFSFACIRLRIVCRSTVNCPFLVSLQMCIKPRKLNVSGFPCPRSRRRSAAYHPNPSRRVFSGCSSRPNFCKRCFNSSQNCLASPPPSIAQPCSGTSLVVRVCPTSRVRSSSSCVLRLPDASPDVILPWENVGSPGSRTRCFRTCAGSVTARDSGTPRLIGAPVVAFRITGERRLPGVSKFSRLNNLARSSPCQRFDTSLARGSA
jgi:hypothetical protein